jgi:shikimate kinase
VARLILVGLPGVGKSTLARALGDRWSCGCVDTDALIASRVGIPTAQYLREHGEGAFRAVELEVLREALVDDVVVATGAGVVTIEPARDLLEKELTVWLDADDEVLLARVEDGERPLLGGDHRASLANLRAQREAWYESVASFRVDASGSNEDVLELVLEGVGSITT